MDYTEYWFNLLSSSSFKQAFYALALGALLLGLTLVVVAFAFYGRTREAEESGSLDPKWVMLFATWRDSLIITLLFSAQALIYRYADFMGMSTLGMTNVLTTYTLVQPMLVYIFDILIVVVAVMRIIAITRFLKRAGV
ncbi:MAG: hypothetical protein EP336_12005 [Rhodobacteraceae bacterium]|nr:MAG: hypothetical protein EP336_12005 [Paracoccaceae bacterium]